MEGTLKFTKTSIAAAVVFTTMTLPAMAESRFDTTISGAQDGFLSRIWFDNNYDNISTNIYFGGCDRAHQRVGIYRQVSGVDPSMGEVTLCSEVRGYWGDLRRDDYRFKLLGGSDIDIDRVGVEY